MRRLRSLLFVPGDSAKKLGKVDGCGADAVILDLEDAVAPERKVEARALVAGFLAARPQDGRALQLWVRINTLNGDLALADLAAVVAAAPDGVMLPKAAGPADVARLSHYLDALEVQAGVAPGSIGVILVATETAAAPFALGAYAGAGLTRLVGLTWGAEDLSAALGASTNRAADGSGWAFTYRMVRAQMLLAAHAAGVAAIETLSADFTDADALLADSRAARAEGFTGRLAIHPAQVAPINAGFLPDDAEVAEARRVIAAFDAAPGQGTVGLDGRMLDRPHLLAARRTLGLAGA